MSARVRRNRAPKIDLSTPRRNRRLRLGVHYDPEAFGRFSEGIARFIGTARFLVFQTMVIIVWILWNLFAPDSLRFDTWKRGLVLLTLVLSLQAAYAAPLILLAQNRQADRDRRINERDRDTAIRTQADTEFLARELAAIRIALADVATNDELAKAIDHAVARARIEAARDEASVPSRDSM
jgi:uncharacterized membrane protein